MSRPPSLDVLRRAAAARLAAVSEAPDLEARRLLAHATGLTDARLIIEAPRPATPKERARFEPALARRRAGEPLAYITGRIGFHALELHITPAVLVPRPDTETLVAAALARLPAAATLQIADLGTGSGAIALALAAARPRWQLLATDISPAALACARANARRLGLANVQCAAGDWLAPLAGRRLDAIVANPPYIDAADPHLADPALRHEPRQALVAADQGRADIARIVAHAPCHLRPGGWLLVEHGATQAESVTRLFEAASLHTIATVTDLAKRPRITVGQRGKRAACRKN
jgi:release factor glutamine methyltransferase